MQILKLIAFTGLIFSLGATVGWAIRDRQPPNALSFPFETTRSVSALHPGTSFACTSIAATAAEANVFQNAMVVEAQPGTDRLAIRVTPDGKGLGLLTTAAVEIGLSQDDPMPVLESTKDYFVAGQYGTLRSDVVFLDRKTMRGVWTWAGLGVTGLFGRSMLIACH